MAPLPVLAAVLAPALPSSMRAFVKQSSVAAPKYEADYPSVPALGDLHKTYTGLPDSCEVVVKVAASSINPSDISPTTAVLPHVLGSDVSGTVVQVQDSCSRLKVGDKVWGDIGANCGKGKELGGYGEYAAALESQLGFVPPNIGMLEAGVLGKVSLTSYKAYAWYAGAPWNNTPTVLVLGGSGGTGSVGLQLAKKAFGAGKVITTTSAANFDYCRSLGADQLIDYKTQNWWDVLGSDSVDIIYDTVGQEGTGNRAMDKIRAGGYYVTITGALATKVKPGVKQSMFINSNTNLNNTAELDALSAIVAKDQLRLTHFQAVLPLSGVEQGFNISKTHLTVGKVVISVSNDTAA
eukprot:TRINITY_DN43829_c0_g1_i1.p1 TRINITY_DN43829_c0_g1~~TRINITY_DN43829_c0_g1_i1.p1  ORF type:complete len:369 (+),score=131.21 TRINITY_DN43829_c0_g1_i1:55-1107(+)